MKNSNSQLFRIVKNVELPTVFLLESSTIKKSSKILISFSWPDGSPCIPIERYLLERSYELQVREDGGSLKTIASKLTHLARFCYSNSIQFWELNETTFRQFVLEYLECGKHSVRGFSVRKNNTNIDIVSTCIAFLQWCQTTITVGRVIVGLRESKPQIRLVKKVIHRSKFESTTVAVYPFTSEPDTPEPKGPMPGIIRNKLWDATESAGGTSVERAYLAARREQMLSLLEATGCRPGELAALDYLANKEVVKNGVLHIITLKRRKAKDPIRQVPVSLETSVALDRFFRVERQDMINDLKVRGFHPDESRVFVSSRNGAAASPGSLSKDFQRIVSRAGIEQRACMSMFRHRFITIMVAIHLKDHLSQNKGGTKDQILIVDQLTILKRVAVFTGHGNPESLLPYIDLAWEYLGIFKPIDQARDIARLLSEATVHIRTIGKKLVDNRKLSRSLIVDKLVEEIKLLEIRIRKVTDPESNMRSL